MEDVYGRGLKKLDPQSFENIAISKSALIIDTREPQAFAKGFIPGSINIGLGGQFAPWIGALVTDLKQPILLITEPGKEEEAITRLARVSYDFTLGYLDGGFENWEKANKPIDRISSISAAEFLAFKKSGEVNTIDVRKPSEYEEGHLADVPNRPLDFINDWIGELDKNKTYHIHCAGGYRSMIASSIFKSRGFKNPVDITGGYGAVKSINQTQII